MTFGKSIVENKFLERVKLFVLTKHWVGKYTYTRVRCTGFLYHAAMCFCIFRCSVTEFFILKMQTGPESLLFSVFHLLWFKCFATLLVDFLHFWNCRVSTICAYSGHLCLYLIRFKRAAQTYITCYLKYVLIWCSHLTVCFFFSSKLFVWCSVQFMMNIPMTSIWLRARQWTFVKFYCTNVMKNQFYCSRNGWFKCSLCRFSTYNM